MYNKLKLLNYLIKV